MRGCLLLLAAAGLARESISSPLFGADYDDNPQTTTETNQDLYVIHAMVYEVGILTNSSDVSSENTADKGEQVAVTFFHKNGSDIDFSKIPAPLYTNVTGRALTGLAPAAPATTPQRARRDPQPPTSDESGPSSEPLSSWSDEGYDGTSTTSSSDSASSSVEETESQNTDMFSKRSVAAPELTHFYSRGKRQSVDFWNVKSGSLPGGAEQVVTVPPESSVQSIAIPPLLSLNANLSDIPVPFPNTSIIRYSTLSSQTVPLSNATTG